MSELVCSACDRRYDGHVWRCSCGAPLDYAETPTPDPALRETVDPREGLWAFEPFLPTGPEVSLGEGFTPLVDAPDWSAAFKLEYVFPTGSFKDRGATATLSQAAELGVDRVVEDSSGNAGAAIATYAARADIPAEIYVPASVKASKLRAIERAGADVVRVEGSRQDVTDACIEAVEGAASDAASASGEKERDDPRAGGDWYASHAWNPAFFAGTATFAYELAAQRDWTVPDAVVTPLGHGTLFLGAYRGFRNLLAAGWTDEMPRLLGAQAAGYAPIAAELHGETEGENEVADGIQIREPARQEGILHAIEETGGDAIALPSESVEASLDALHGAGFYVEPTSAVAPAALAEYRERGVVESGDDVVVALTGSGLKT